MHLTRAVEAENKALVSKWVSYYPIEVERDGKDVLISDDTDFVGKFDFIFDAGLRSILTGPNGCQLKTYPDSSSRIADGQIITVQFDKDGEPSIEAISLPKDIKLLERVPDSEYERGADSFFDGLKQAVAAGNRGAVVSMCSYPLRVVLNGKDHRIDNRTELLHDYDRVFTQELMQNILALHAPYTWDGEVS